MLSAARFPLVRTSHHLAAYRGWLHNRAPPQAIIVPTGRAIGRAHAAPVALAAAPSLGALLAKRLSDATP